MTPNEEQEVYKSCEPYKSIARGGQMFVAAVVMQKVWSRKRSAAENRGTESDGGGVERISKARQQRRCVLTC